MSTKDYAAELQAMGAVMEALAPLDRASQESVIKWVLAKLEFGGFQVGDAESDRNVGEQREPSGGQTRGGTINTVVAKIGADSCRTIIIAAAIHLTLYQGKDSFSRPELVGLAKSAKVWKAEYTNQTSTMIGRLADAGIIVEKSKDAYFLPDVTIAEYQQMLG